MLTGLTDKAAQLALVWGGALVFSGLLVGAGRHWSEPLLEQAWARHDPGAPLLLVAVLLVLPPLLMALVLLRGLLRHPPGRGESSD